jgi:hypothetical protein
LHAAAIVGDAQSRLSDANACAELDCDPPAVGPKSMLDAVGDQLVYDEANRHRSVHRDLELVCLDVDPHAVRLLLHRGTKGAEVADHVDDMDFLREGQLIMSQGDRTYAAGDVIQRALDVRFFEPALLLREG